MSDLDSTLMQERLKELLHYDPETGIFTWLVRNSSRVKVGDVAGCKSNKYTAIGVDGRFYYAHRLAWLYMYGNWPVNMLDHIDSNKSNNKITNLRAANKHENQQNLKKAQSHSISRLIGVSPNGRGWCARIVLNGKQHHCGTFKTPELAHAAYLEAKRRLHPFGTI